MFVSVSASCSVFGGQELSLSNGCGGRPSPLFRNDCVNESSLSLNLRVSFALSIYPAWDHLPAPRRGNVICSSQQTMERFKSLGLAPHCSSQPNLWTRNAKLDLLWKAVIYCAEAINMFARLLWACIIVYLGNLPQKHSFLLILHQRPGPVAHFCFCCQRTGCRQRWIRGELFGVFRHSAFDLLPTWSRFPFRKEQTPSAFFLYLFPGERK